MKSKHKSMVKVIGLVLLLIGVVAFSVRSGYHFLYPVQMKNTIYLEVWSDEAIKNMEEVKRSGAKQVFIYFQNFNPIPFYYMGRGESRMRKLTVNNVYEFPIHVDTGIEGNMSSFVMVSESSFELNPGKNKTIEITVSVPPDAQIGNYTSVLSLDVRRMLSSVQDE